LRLKGDGPEEDYTLAVSPEKEEDDDEMSI